MLRNRASGSINIYKQVYPPGTSSEISIPWAALAVADKPGIAYCIVAQDSGTAYGVKRGAWVHSRMEDARICSAPCKGTGSVSSHRCTTRVWKSEKWGMDLIRCVSLGKGCKNYVDQKWILARASCFNKRKWMIGVPLGEVLCLRELRCRWGHMRPSVKRCTPYSVRCQFMLRCAENSRRLCSGRKAKDKDRMP